MFRMFLYFLSFCSFLSRAARGSRQLGSEVRYSFIFPMGFVFQMGGSPFGMGWFANNCFSYWRVTFINIFWVEGTWTSPDPLLATASKLSLYKLKSFSGKAYQKAQVRVISIGLSLFLRRSSVLWYCSFGITTGSLTYFMILFFRGRS